MFALSDLLVARTRRSLFTAPQSLIFLVATSFVTTFARGARTIVGVEPGAAWPVLLASVLVSLVIVTLSMAIPECRPKHRGELVAVVAVTLANSLLVFVAALGIEKF